MLNEETASLIQWAQFDHIEVLIAIRVLAVIMQASTIHYSKVNPAYVRSSGHGHC